MSKMKLGSLFSGSGGFELAGQISGIEPIFNCEVEPFPIVVTRKQFPNVKHYGDVSSISGSEVEPVDIITFGSPCQDLSMAGKRVGLDGRRSGLFYQAIRIIEEMRCATDGIYPRFAVWENVPGALSSSGGEDFRSVLEAFCQVKCKNVSVPRPERWPNAGEILGDGFSIAWRVLDAQRWGVPQRRKRIFLVADFGGSGAGPILFESESVPGHLETCFNSWKRVTGSAAVGAGVPSICLNDQGGKQFAISNDVTGTLRAEMHGHPPLVLAHEPQETNINTQYAGGFCPESSATTWGIGWQGERSPTLRGDAVPAVVQLYENHSQDTRYTGPLDVAPTVSATYGMGGNNQPFVTEQVKVYGISSFGSNAMMSDNPHSGVYETATSRTLDLNGGSPACNQGGIAIVEKTYSSQGNMIGRNEPQNNAPETHYAVRRLTPTECARLQGFPDWWCHDLGNPNPTDEDVAFWTDVWETHRQVVSHAKKAKTEKQIRKWLENPYTDSAEYKMWGNGVALPCVVYVLASIKQYVDKENDKTNQLGV